MATRARILRDVLVDVAAIGWREEERAWELPQVHVRKHEDFATSVRKNGLAAFNLFPFSKNSSHISIYRTDILHIETRSKLKGYAKCNQIDSSQIASK